MEGRNELKFVFNINKIYHFYSWMNNTSKLNKKFPDRIVNSLYLDDINFESAKDNLIGISKRQKYRIRWYNEISDKKEFFFEIKKKINKLSFKEVYPIIINDYNLNLFTVNDLLEKSVQYLDIKQSIQLKRLYPALVCSYKRQYFENVDGLRVTIDHDLSFSEIFKYSKLRNHFSHKSDKIIVEFKFPEALKKHVHQKLYTTYFRPIRNSKYLLGLHKLGRISYI